LMAMVALVTAAVTGCSFPSTILADYPSYSDVESLFESATLVVEGDVGESRVDVLYPSYEGDDPAFNPLAGTDTRPDPKAGAVPITVFEVRITKVHSGDAKPGDLIEVQQLGGSLDGVEYSAEGTASLAKGSAPLLFLETYDDAPAAILGGDAGLLEATGDEFVSAGDPNLVISLGELERR